MRYVAFLRAINTGTRRVKMADLQEAFATNGYPAAATHLASGNVIFDSETAPDPVGIEGFLDERFGFVNRVFVRSAENIVRLIADVPWTDPGDLVEVSFLEREPDRAAARALEATAVAPERLLVVGAEVLYLREGKNHQQVHKESTTVRLLGSETTRRGMATVRGLHDRHLIV